MKRLIVCYIAILIINFNSISSISDFESKFIGDLFLNESFMVTVHFCWKYDKQQDFLKSIIHLPKLRQIATYNDSLDYYNYFFHKSSNNYFILDLTNCNQSWNILEQANQTGLFRFPLKYLLFLTEIDFISKLSPILSNYSIYPNSNLLVAINVDEKIILSQPYRVNASSEVNVLKIVWQDYGIWTLNNGLQKSCSDPLARRRINLNRTTITSGFLMDEPETWDHLDDTKHPRIDTFAKQNYPTIKALVELTNSHWNVVRVLDYGYYNNDTQMFSGLIRMVELGQVDLSGTSPFLTLERLNVVEFLKMLNKMPMQFILKEPPLSFLSNIYVLPFSRRVWIALFATVVLFFGALFVIMNWESKKFIEVDLRSKYSVSDIILLVFEGVCQQGTVFESKLIPGRILQFIMFLTFLFLYTSFSAYIIVLLQTTVDIKSWKQLLDSNIAVGGHNTSYMHVYLSGSKNPIHQEIYKKKIGPKGYYDIDVGMAKVQKGFFALHAEVAGGLDYIAEKFTDFEMCQVQIMPGFVEHFKGHTCVPKNSPYKEIFKIGLLRMDEYGIQRRNYNRLLKPLKCYSKGGNFVSVGISDMIQALLIFSYGIGIAIIILFLELYAYKRQKKRLLLKGNFRRNGICKYEYTN